jgi:hypothetical protein
MLAVLQEAQRFLVSRISGRQILDEVCSRSEDIRAKTMHRAGVGDRDQPPHRLAIE